MSTKAGARQMASAVSMDIIRGDETKEDFDRASQEWKRRRAGVTAVEQKVTSADLLSYESCVVALV